MGLQAVKPEEWPVGQRVLCPKCGKEGKAGISVFRAKGREYVYCVVNHANARKCVVGRAEKSVLQAVKPEEEVARWKSEVEKLREENEQLREQVARLKEENQQLREAIAAVYNARIAVAREYERECVRKVGIQRKTGLPEHVRATAWSILHALAGSESVDWVAVRLDAFEQLARFL